MKKVLTLVLCALLAAGGFSCALVSDKSPVRKVSLADGEKRSVHEDWANDYMIVTQGPYSSMAGRQMFEQGGNVVDAAVAVSFAISVERPQSTGLGGGGFALLRMLGESEKKQRPRYHALDFREKAPLNAHKDMFLNEEGEPVKKKSREGSLAVGVPGLVAGLLEVHKKYGKLSLKSVMRPAIKLAKNGFPVYPELDHALSKMKETILKYPETRKIFAPEGSVLSLGDILVQKDLASTLRLIAEEGRDGFYRNRTATGILKTLKKYDGVMRRGDLDDYNVKWRKPITGMYKGNRILSMPPPSSGGVHIVQILNTVENDDLGDYGIHHPKSMHLMSAAMQQAFADRAKNLGDSDFVSVPLEELASEEYAAKVRKGIPSTRAIPSSKVKGADFSGKEAKHTTHFTIADKKGNIFTSTQTINGYFGSGLVAEGTGIVLNNEMDDFAAKVGAQNMFGAVGGDPNLVEPEKRPLSSMSPTIVEREGKPVLALGSPSGTRILTCVANTILNYLEYDLDLYDAVSAVRYHHQWFPDEIWVDEPGIPENTQKTLEDWGHKVKNRNLGCRVQALAFEDGKLHGVSDPRGEGMSTGDGE